MNGMNGIRREFLAFSVLILIFASSAGMAVWAANSEAKNGFGFADGFDSVQDPPLQLEDGFEEEDFGRTIPCCGCGCWDGSCCGTTHCCRAIAWPVPLSQRITQRFGPAHNGIDIGPVVPGRDGDAVVAYISGNVVLTGSLQGYGEVVYVDSASVNQFPWIQHRYAHLQLGTRIPTLSFVNAGAHVGKMGNTGTSTGTHLHFETRRSIAPPTNANNSTTPIDPLVNFFPHIRSFTFDINPLEASNHFEIFVFTAGGEYFTLDNLSVMSPDEIDRLGIAAESIQAAIDTFGVDAIQSYIEALGAPRAYLPESLGAIESLFRNHTTE